MNILEGVGILLLLATVPGTVELALLSIGAILSPKKGGFNNRAQSQPKIAVIVPAHNEEKGIARTLHSLKVCPDPFQLIVVADNCTDKTASVAQIFKVRTLVRTDSEHKGKHYALQYAFDELLKEDFDLFVVVDADTIVGPNLIDALSTAFKNGAEAIQVRYAMERPYESYRNRLLNIAFSAFNYLRPKGRQRWGFSGGILGNGFALSRKILEEVPFREISIVEDLAYHLQLVMHHRKVTFIDTTAVYAKIASDKASFDTQRTRWEGGRLRLLGEQFWPTLKGIFKGNFLLVEPLLDLLLLPLGYHALLLFLLLLVPLGIAKSFAILGFIVLALHIVIAIRLINGGRKDYYSLLMAPLYIFEKIGRLGKIFSGALRGDWNRTPREK